jgi:arginyl-tRNA--protein-N-Asp/Glu arginylyltransferase
MDDVAALLTRAARERFPARYFNKLSDEAEKEEDERSSFSETVSQEEVAEALGAAGGAGSEVSLNDVLQVILTSRAADFLYGNNGFSIVKPYHVYPGSCGYCTARKEGRKDTSSSFGMTANRLLCGHYESLIGRGWRRSGTWLYKPQNAVTCCPQVAIRLEAALFKPSRKQRAAGHRWERFASGETASKGGGKSGGNGQKGVGKDETDAVAVMAEDSEALDPLDQPASAASDELRGVVAARIVRALQAAAAASQAVENGSTSLSPELLASVGDLEAVVQKTLRAPEPNRSRRRDTPSGTLLCSGIGQVLAGRFQARKGGSVAGSAASAEATKPSKKQRRQHDRVEARNAAAAIGAQLCEFWDDSIAPDTAYEGQVDAHLAEAGGFVNFVLPSAVPPSSNSAEQAPPARHHKSKSGPTPASGNALPSGAQGHEITAVFAPSSFDREEFDLFVKYQEGLISVRFDLPYVLLLTFIAAFLLH